MRPLVTQLPGDEFSSEESYQNSVQWFSTDSNVFIIMHLGFTLIETKSLLFPKVHSCTSGGLLLKVGVKAIKKYIYYRQ